MKRKFSPQFVLILFLIIGNFHSINAQTISLGILQNFDDFLRSQQLLGKDSLNHSFTSKPLYVNNFSTILKETGLSNFSKTLIENDLGGKPLRIDALPFSWKQQVNTHHPYSLNDGALIPSKRYSTMLSAGLYMQWGPLSIQFRPEFIYADNKSYPLLTDYDQPQSLINSYQGYRRRVDLPVLFGDGPYSKFDLGQSAISLSHKGISLSLSNENLWWGPGRHHTLLMSNNAPGFLHLALSTTKPLTTKIGTFEGQLVSGRLEGSDLSNAHGGQAYTKPTDWRYFNGMVFTYQPKWLPGLSIGFDRSFQLYSKNLGKGFTDLLPVFSFLTKSSFAEDSHSNTEDGKKRDQRMSLFTRWLMTESHAEVYFQYGREDHSWNMRDAFIEPEHSRAYLIGFRKLFPFSFENDDFIQVGLEVIQTDASSSQRVRSMSYWFTNSGVPHGYTHKGKFIGNSYGPDNVQTLDLAWLKGVKKIGLVVERRVHNNEMYLRAFSSTMDSRRRWVDLNIIGQLDWNFNNFVINSQAGLIKSFNYQYYLPTPSNGEYWYGPKNDVHNIHLKLGIMYLW